MGGADSGSSVALYADGSLYHNNKLLKVVLGNREEAETAAARAIKIARVNNTPSDVADGLTPSASVITASSTGVESTGDQDTVASALDVTEVNVKVPVEEEKSQLQDHLAQDASSSFADEMTVTALSAVEILSRFTVGTKVEANYKGRGKWYKGVIMEVVSGDVIKYAIDYDDGEKESAVSEDRIRFRSTADAEVADARLKEAVLAADRSRADKLVKQKAPLFGRGSLIACKVSALENDFYVVDVMVLLPFGLHRCLNIKCVFI